MNRADWCNYHKGPSGTARAVRRHERPSGGTAVYYACAPCREQRGLTPIDSAESLARTRMQATGESYPEALAALRGEPRPPAPAADVIPLRRDSGTT